MAAWLCQTSAGFAQEPATKAPSTSAPATAAGPPSQPKKNFTQSWQELARIEKDLATRIQAKMVLELRGYLLSKWFRAGITDNEKLKHYQEEEAALLKDILSVHDSLPAAVTEVTAFLREQHAQFDKIPGLFENLDHDPLYLDFLKDTRGETFFHQDLAPGEVVPLLRLSMEHAKAAYEDAAFQIEFVGKNLALFETSGSRLAGLANELMEQNPEINRYRKELRLPYGDLKKDSSEKNHIQFLLRSRARFDGRHRSDLHRPGGKLQDWITIIGGFENFILDALEVSAIESLQAGNMKRALELIQFNAYHRIRHPLGTHAAILACNGQPEVAYLLHQKAVANSYGRMDVFNLESEPGDSIRSHSYTHMFRGPAVTYSLRPAQAENSRKYAEFVNNLPWAKLIETKDPGRLFASQEFLSLSTFQKMGIICMLEYHAEERSKAHQQALVKVINQHEVARLVYEMLRKE